EFRLIVGRGARFLPAAPPGIHVGRLSEFRAALALSICEGLNFPLRWAENMSSQQITPNSSERHVLPPRAPFDPGKRSDALSEAFKLIGAAVRFERNTEIHGEDEPAEYFYQVASGAVRTYKVLSDGRRQIGAFHLPGDLF